MTLFYLVSTPREVKYPTHGKNLRGLTNCREGYSEIYPQRNMTLLSNDPDPEKEGKTAGDMTRKQETCHL